jgi:hypothetical protein
MAIACIYCGKCCSNLSGATRHLNHCIRRKHQRIYPRHPVIQFQDRLAEIEAAYNDNSLTSGLLYVQQMQLAEEVDHTDSYTGIDTRDILEIEANVEAEAIDTRSDDEHTNSRSSSLHKGLLSTDSTYTTTSFEEITGTPAGTAFCTDGKDTRDPNKRTKEIIRCSEDWRNSGSPRCNFVWVQEYGCLDKSTSEVEQIQGRMIGRSILFITVKDVECEPGPDGQVPRYYGTILSMMRLRNKGRAHAIHGMIEFEDSPVPEHTAPKTGRNGKIRCYDIQTVHRSVHAVPARLDDNNRLWYVNNFIDWDSYNTLFNSDWREENKREVKKVKRRLGRQ